MAFSKRSNYSRQTPEQSRRQGEVVQLAWRRFEKAAPVIAFLNSLHGALEGQPLHLAIESDSGLERVQAWLEQDALRA